LFERLREALRAALDGAAPPEDLRDLARRMRDAVVRAKVGVQDLRDGLASTETQLAAERQRLMDAERRGRLAGEIQDGETVRVAERFAAKHRERVAVLERKVRAQRDELELAERELGEMQAQLKAAERGRPAAQSGQSSERAWRDIESAGGVRPGGGLDLDDELLKREVDRAAREAAADRQLQELKKRMKE
jgi:hypothetical protein